MSLMAPAPADTQRRAGLRRMRLLASGESSVNVLLRLRRGDKRKSILASFLGWCASTGC